MRLRQTIILPAVAGAVGEEDVVAGDFDAGVAIPAVGVGEEGARGLPGLAVVFRDGSGEGRALAAEGGIDLAVVVPDEEQVAIGQPFDRGGREGRGRGCREKGALKKHSRGCCDTPQG